MRLYNTLTRSEEEFAPADGKTVRMYTCGLTVYARGHIGNFRTFVSLDVLRRALKYQEGYEVRQVTNFTDVDDKTIAASEAADVSLREYTDCYIEAFREDATAMGLEQRAQEVTGALLRRALAEARQPVEELDLGRALAGQADLGELDGEGGQAGGEGLGDGLPEVFGMRGEEKQLGEGVGWGQGAAVGDDDGRRA